MPDSGTLSVRVFTSQAELPIEGATVVVTRPALGGKMELLSLQITDSSGLIQPVAISAPPLIDSTAPLPPSSTDRPCSLCSIWAEHQGYAMLQVEGVQIFPGVRTLQEMRLIPLSPGESSLQQRDTRTVTPQGL